MHFNKLLIEELNKEKNIIKETEKKLEELKREFAFKAINKGL